MLEPAEAWGLVAAAREREKVAAAVDPKADDKGAVKMSGRDRDEARGRNKIAKYPSRKEEKRCHVVTELDRRRVADAAAVACAARSPPGQTGFAFVQTAATRLRMSPGSPAISSLVQDAGQ